MRELSFGARTHPRDRSGNALGGIGRGPLEPRHAKFARSTRPLHNRVFRTVGNVYATLSRQTRTSVCCLIFNAMGEGWLGVGRASYRLFFTCGLPKGATFGDEGVKIFAYRVGRPHSPIVTTGAALPGWGCRPAFWLPFLRVVFAGVG